MTRIKNLSRVLQIWNFLSKSITRLPLWAKCCWDCVFAAGEGIRAMQARHNEWTDTTDNHFFWAKSPNQITFQSVIWLGFFRSKCLWSFRSQSQSIAHFFADFKENGTFFTIFTQSLNCKIEWMSKNCRKCNNFCHSQAIS